MRADGLPIGDSPVFMIGADRFVQGPFGDSDMVRVPLDWGIGIGLGDWQWIDILVQDWQMGQCLPLCRHWIGGLLMDLQICLRFASDSWIGD